MNLKNTGLEILQNFGYTPEKLLNESDLKINQLLSKMIMEERIKDSKIQTGFFVIHENKESKEEKPILEFWIMKNNLTEKVKEIDLGELILEAIPENERQTINQAERMFNFKMENHLKSVYKVINCNLNDEEEEQKQKVCALVLIGKERLNIQLCTFVAGQYNVYNRVSFIDFSK